MGISHEVLEHIIYDVFLKDVRKETTAGQRDNLKYVRNEPNPLTISGMWNE